ncbi:hypothetical protein [Leclercia sp.]|uniref:hypothetical protein n=1 Tax=Leclercia sp. TaxID=1898428 RepID=UPI0028AE73BF|nr:hypothetical protein [Leclercia sp.]
MKVINVNARLSSTSEFMGDRYLEVDGKISPNWAHFFDSAHANSWHNMKRSVRVEGNYIVVNCPLEELQTQINEIQNHCAQADRDLAAWNAEQLSIQQQQQQETDEAEKKANAVFKNLKF